MTAYSIGPIKLLDSPDTMIFENCTFVSEPYGSASSVGWPPLVTTKRPPVPVVERQRLLLAVTVRRMQRRETF